MTRKRRVSFFIDDDLADSLIALKASHGIPAAEAMRRGIREYLERHLRTVPLAGAARRGRARRKG